MLYREIGRGRERVRERDRDRKVWRCAGHLTWRWKFRHVLTAFSCDFKHLQTTKLWPVTALRWTENRKIQTHKLRHRFLHLHVDFLSSCVRHHKPCKKCRELRELRRRKSCCKKRIYTRFIPPEGCETRSCDSWPGRWPVQYSSLWKWWRRLHIFGWMGGPVIIANKRSCYFEKWAKNRTQKEIIE